MSDVRAPARPPRLPFPADRPAEPPAAYAWVRRECPVSRVRMPSGDLGWLVSRYRDARFALSDRRLSKAALTEPGAPRIRPGTLPPGLLFTTDPPEHTALRIRATAALTRTRTGGLRAAVAEIAEELVDGFAARAEADLVADFARPFAMRVMCMLLGVPLGDRDRFAHWAETVLAVDGHAPEDVERAQRDLMAYTAALVTARTAVPSDDLVSALARDGDDATAVSLAATFLVTGYETMVAAVANAALTLLIRGGLPTPWPADPRALIEELLRLGTFGDALRSRRATTDVTVGGVVVPAGDVVLVSLASANRDETVFTEPDRLLPGRTPRHLSFGHGAHYCPGARLARVELETALRCLATRLPGLRLAMASQEVVPRAGSAERPPERLTVRWGPPGDADRVRPAERSGCGGGAV
ncbi:cytochrome P450 [Streptomyces sp. NEAU-Y11]|uniref:cytochrome P450 n=1 Tax=Streptomyces cucumeris TaxID=2962890 RepID=UPI0020C85B3C|nr:cytochrome P450 [Streptomyces sp. NEAU-Y11]MCP9211058.1 cytochrome P450 [Streptomyces sp. NEAU-Y11]